MGQSKPKKIRPLQASNPQKNPFNARDRAKQIQERKRKQEEALKGSG